MNTEAVSTSSGVKLLNIGFLGVGWIGRNRMDALVKGGLARAGVISDIDTDSASQAAMADTVICGSLQELLEYSSLDGIVIATPSALHAQQTIAALDAGFAVFCQKPLGRDLCEVKRVMDSAISRNRLLGIDFSYRFLKTVSIVQALVNQGDIGRIFAADAVFHNAYGPDKPWFYDSELSGGGCVMDLGIHLVDLVLWLFGFPRVFNVNSRLYARGQRITGRRKEVEDYAVAMFDLENGCTVRVACSWKLQAGTDAVIGLTLYGTEGALCIRNSAGSFYDFYAERYRGTAREILYGQSDRWGGEAIVHWAKRLAQDNTFDQSVVYVQNVAEVLDLIYRNS